MTKSSQQAASPTCFKPAIAWSLAISGLVTVAATLAVVDLVGTGFTYATLQQQTLAAVKDETNTELREAADARLLKSLNPARLRLWTFLSGVLAQTASERFSLGPEATDNGKKRALPPELYTFDGFKELEELAQQIETAGPTKDGSQSEETTELRASFVTKTRELLETACVPSLSSTTVSTYQAARDFAVGFGFHWPVLSADPN